MYGTKSILETNNCANDFTEHLSSSEDDNGSSESFSILASIVTSVFRGSFANALRSTYRKTLPLERDDHGLSDGCVLSCIQGVLWDSDLYLHIRVEYSTFRNAKKEHNRLEFPNQFCRPNVRTAFVVECRERQFSIQIPLIYSK